VHFEIRGKYARLAKVSTYPPVDLPVEEPVAPANSAAVPEKAAPARRAAPKASRVPELDGLRGIAISLVVAYHFFYFSPPNSYQPQGLLSRLYLYFEQCISVGWSGVDLFFVLSGFLIGGILLDKRESPRYFRTFYARRFFRIIPVYYVWSSAFMLAALVLGWSARALSPMMPVQFLFLQNLGLVAYVGLARPWFEPTWSLAVEEQFYLVSPLLVRWLSRKALYVLLGAVVIGAVFFRIWVHGQAFSFAHTADWPYTLMLSRADALSIGILAALLWKDSRVRSWLTAHSNVIRLTACLLAIGVIALAQWSPSFRSFPMQSAGYTWMAGFYAMLLLLVLANPSGMLGSVARLKILREIGKVSYCLYLIHQAVGTAVQATLDHLTGPVQPVLAVAGYAFAALAAYGIAQLSWKYFERPLLERGHSVSY
jgi:peptidoglycan/LPS O-acetylase OafA/YrhL